MRNFILSTILLLGLSACESDSVQIENKDLIGHWNWKSTDGGMAFHIHETPSTTGKSIQLKLTQDNKYTITENNTAVSKGTFTLSMHKSIYSGEKERFIALSENYQNVVLSGIIKVEEGSVLHISDNHYDGLGSSFNRIE